MPNGPSRKAPASRSSSAPNTLGESKRGTHSQSTAPSAAISGPVWQLERKAYSSIGENGEGMAALWNPSAPVMAALAGLARLDPLAGLMGAPTVAHSSR